MAKNLVYQAFTMNLSGLARDVKSNKIHPLKVREAISSLFDALKAEGYQVLVEQSIICGSPKDFVVGGELNKDIKNAVYSRVDILGDYLRSGNWYAPHYPSKKSPKRS